MEKLEFGYCGGGGHLPPLCVEMRAAHPVDQSSPDSVLEVRFVVVSGLGVPE